MGCATSEGCHSLHLRLRFSEGDGACDWERDPRFAAVGLSAALELDLF